MTFLVRIDFLSGRDSEIPTGSQARAVHTAGPDPPQIGKTIGFFYRISIDFKGLAARPSFKIVEKTSGFLKILSNLLKKQLIMRLKDKLKFSKMEKKLPKKQDFMTA